MYTLGHLVKEYVLYQPKARRVEYNAATAEEVNTYNYDHANRLTEVTHSIDDQPARLLAGNTYDELGRISNIDRYHPSVTSLANSYLYNIRSWVTDITGNLFKENLKYYDAGNILQMDWALDGKMRTYRTDTMAFPG